MKLVVISIWTYYYLKEEKIWFNKETLATGTSSTGNWAKIDIADNVLKNWNRPIWQCVLTEEFAWNQRKSSHLIASLIYTENLKYLKIKI